MKYCILILLIIQTASATIDLEKLKESLQTQIMSLKDTAVANIQEIKDNIDYDKLNRLDVLGIIPIVQTKGKLLKLKHKAKQNKIRLVFSTIKGLKSKAYSAVPWPAVRRIYLD